MQSFSLTSISGKPYKLELPKPKSNFVSKYVFAFAKSGSTLLDNMLSVYCRHIDFPTFSLFNQAFDQGVATSDIGPESRFCFQPNGYLYTGFRHFPHYDLDLADSPAILLVRDPRDMAVSMYYSIMKSHVIPKGMESMYKTRSEAEQTSIDQYALKRIGGYMAQLKRYQQALQGKTLKVYRYEDVIYNKQGWFKDVLQTLDIEIIPDIAQSVVSQFDIIPEQEDQEQHIRQVHPGNFRKKLSETAIAQMNQKAKLFLEEFDYDA